MKITDTLVNDLLSRGILTLLGDKLYVNPLLDQLKWDVSYGFEHVSISQKKNLVTSRLDVDTTSEVVRGVRRPIPMIAANMSTVCNAQFCIQLHKLGALGIMHRAAPEEELLDEIQTIAESVANPAASVGVGEDQIIFSRKLIERGAEILCVDIAHGYSDSVIEMGQAIRDINPDVKIILGNTTNVGLLVEAAKANVADAIKVGIAQGSACETKNTAGCTEKQFSAVLKFKNVAKEYGIPVISDGGIREPADMVKAIAAGANSIMAGSVFARCPESAAPVYHIDGKDKKLYAGMASRFVQQMWKGGLKEGTCPEGKVNYLELGESVEKLLERWSGALKSGITYAGGYDIESFQANASFVKLAAC